MDENQKKAYLDPYISDYEKLAKIINSEVSKENKFSNFKMLEEPLKYSEFKGNILDFPKIKTYYFGKC